MTCKRCEGSSCVTTGRFAGKLCRACVRALHLNTVRERRVRASASNGGWGGRSFITRQHTGLKLPIRPAS